MNFQLKKTWKNWLIKTKRRNIQLIQETRTNHAYYVGLNPGSKKMGLRRALDKTFCSNQQPLTHRRLKQRQRTKLNKTMLSAPSPCPPPPHRFFTPSSQYQNWKANKCSIPAVNELGPRYWSPQLGSQNFMLPLILNTNLMKQKSKIGDRKYTIWDRLDWEPPAVITATLCSSANGKSLQVLYTHP